MKYEINKKDYIINTDFYSAILSHKHGGTLRKLIYKGADTRLTREGAEYWSNDNDHYEQEYSNDTKIEFVVQDKDCIKIKVNARLISPQLQKDGGYCEAVYYFYNGFIKGESCLFPNFKVGHYDRYVCFVPNVYTHYKFDNNDYYKIENIKTGNNVKGAKITNKSIGIEFIPDKKLILTGIYPSESMLEIKSVDYNPGGYKTKTESIIHPFKL